MEELLDDNIEKEQKVYPLASQGDRLTNYFIDYIAMMLFGVVIVLIYFFFIDPDSDYLYEEDTGLKAKLIEYALGAVITIMYYLLCETLFKGKTLGKLITKTRAINLDNSKMGFEDTLLRTLCRIIPFEAFSFLGNGPGWHDKFSDTKVIKDRDWVDPTNF